MSQIGQIRTNKTVILAVRWTLSWGYNNTLWLCWHKFSMYFFNIK